MPRRVPDAMTGLVPAHAKDGPIAIFLPSLAGGGAERVMLNLARGLAESGMQVDLLIASSQGPLRPEPVAGQRVVELGASGALSALPGLARYLRTGHPRVLLSAMEHGNLVSLWAKALAGSSVAVIATVHVDLPARWKREPPRGRTRLFPLLIRHYYPKAQAIVAVSQGAATGLHAAVRLGPEQVRVIHNPIVSGELVELAGMPATHPWFLAEEPVFLGVGRLVPQKDFVTLIRAFARVRDRVPARLLILGEGPEHAHLLRLARKLDVHDSVELPGFVSNPYAFMRRAAAVVLSSSYEGFGNVLVEAMACGTAVVSTDCPSGPAEILEGGRYGPLVAVGDVDRLADAMIEVLQHPPDRDRLRGRAEEFSVASVAQQYLRLMEGLPEPETALTRERP
jgi:glycosyltransferase involved in cell wall biosynthesis